jgi:hypothetical protein
MKSIIILAAITLTGCLPDIFEASLYCDDVLIATSKTSFTTSGSTYRYRVDGQHYRYIAIEGSVCKIVELD